MKHFYMVFVSSVPRTHTTAQRRTWASPVFHRCPRPATCSVTRKIPRTQHTSALTAGLHHSERTYNRVSKEERHRWSLKKSLYGLPTSGHTQCTPVSTGKRAVTHVQWCCPGKLIKDSAPRFSLGLVMWTLFFW